MAVCLFEVEHQRPVLELQMPSASGVGVRYSHVPMQRGMGEIKIGEDWTTLTERHRYSSGTCEMLMMRAAISFLLDRPSST